MADLQETETTQSETTESQSEESEAKCVDRSSSNPSVARCIRAWNRAYRKKLDNLGKHEEEYHAKNVANDRYLRAMPPLAGYQNVCDFIACVTYASLVDILRPSEVDRLFAAAKVALGTMRYEPKPLPEPAKPNN